MKHFLGQRPLPSMEYHRPTKLEETLRLLEEHPGNYKIIAGGTDLIPAVRRGGISFPGPVHMIDISASKELDFIKKEDDRIRIGAVTRLSEIAKSDLIREYALALTEAVHNMSSLQVRNIGTIGGNLCNASPAADTAPPLLVFNCSVKLKSMSHERVVPLKDFFVGPSKTVLIPGEILTEVQIPIPSSAGFSTFLKLGRRNTFTLSIVAVAVWTRVKGEILDDIRIALGAVAPTPIRALRTEENLIGRRISEQDLGEGLKAVIDDVKPIDDVRGSAAYRKDMSFVLTKRAVQSCLKKSLAQKSK